MDHLPISKVWDRLGPLSDTMRIVIVSVILAVALYWMQHDANSTTRKQSRDAAAALRITQRNSCDRGNALKALVRIRRPDIAGVYLLLNCRRTVGRKKSVPLSRAAADALVERVRTCLVPHPSAWCLRLVNGPIEMPH